jgi:hypothetical protein
MKTIREYVIPGVGQFSIEQSKEGDNETFKKTGADITLIPEAFYGAHGVMLVTDACKTQEEAESALVKTILRDLDREETGHKKRIKEIENIRDGLNESALRQYQTE